MDFCYWGVNEIAGWRVMDLPADVAINLWIEWTKRRQNEINAYSYSAAILAGAKCTKPGEQIKIADYLPYNNEDKKQQAKALPESLQEEIWRLDLPPAMLSDLIRNKLIAPRGD